MTTTNLGEFSVYWRGAGWRKVSGIRPSDDFNSSPDEDHFILLAELGATSPSLLIADKEGTGLTGIVEH